MDCLVVLLSGAAAAETISHVFHRPLQISQYGDLCSLSVLRS
jgi:hypothetical protein